MKSNKYKLKEVKMFYGAGRAGMGSRIGGRGIGFRGTTPPWPYVGRGRGGLPRCGYYFSRDQVPSMNPQVNQGISSYYGTPGGNEELNYLKYQAEVMKKQLEQIELRINDLEAD